MGALLGQNKYFGEVLLSAEGDYSWGKSGIGIFWNDAIDEYEP